ncbi:Angiogenic factor with G patch and FHA domains 1 [Blyttiomyces sp. JEL0837]|nr:Angiogenic factor with G patch and FHA domains 1 [Blyttiomyces sp. JEL0837]
MVEKRKRDNDGEDGKVPNDEKEGSVSNDDEKEEGNLPIDEEKEEGKVSNEDGKEEGECSEEGSLTVDDDYQDNTTKPTQQQPDWILHESGFYIMTDSSVLYDPNIGVYATWENDISTWAQTGEHMSSNQTLKLLVIESSLSMAPPGSIVLVDNRISIGRDREEKEARLRLAELSVSRCHSRIFRNKILENSIWTEALFIKDEGSTHGTTVNNVRISEPKCISKIVRLQHLDRIRIGSTVLEVHLHEWGCEKCLIKDNLISTAPIAEKKSVTSTISSVPTTENLEDLRLKELKRLKSATLRPSISSASSSYSSSSISNVKSAYTNRAAARRERYGQINEHDVQEFRSLQTVQLKEKPRSSAKSVDPRTADLTNPLTVAPPPLPPDTVALKDSIGEKLLMKMGWEKGGALGKDGNGIAEPIMPTTREGRRGLGK